MGGSIPEDVFERVNYVGRVPGYAIEIRVVFGEWKEFETVKM